MENPLSVSVINFIFGFNITTKIKCLVIINIDPIIHFVNLVVPFNVPSVLNSNRFTS